MTVIEMFFVSIVIILLSVCSAKIEEISVASRNMKNFLPTDGWEKKIDQDSWLWPHYEFNDGIGNREEVRIENIEIWKNSHLPENLTNWQVLQFNGEIYLGGTQKYTFLMYHFDTRNYTTSVRAKVPIVGTIKIARLISLPQDGSNPFSDYSIHLIMVVEKSDEKSFLKWFDLQEDTFVEAWIMSLTSPVMNLEYFSFNDEHKLLLAYEGELYYNQTLSVVEIYDIATNRHSPKLRLCHKFSAPETFDVKICQFEGTRLIISLVNTDSILLYEYRDEDVAKCHFKEVRSIKITSLTDVICFESGYMHYLSIVNSSLNIFNIDHEEHLHPVKLDESITGEEKIKSVQSLPVSSYRDESILLVQLENSTVMVLSWQRLEFKRVLLSNHELDRFNLSEIIIVPQYGFFEGESFVKLDTKLHPVTKPHASELEKMLVRKSTAEEILNMQESMVHKVNLGADRAVLDDFISCSVIEPDRIGYNETTLDQIESNSIASKKQDSPLQERMTNYECIDSRMSRLEEKLYDSEEMLSKNIEENVSNLLSRDLKIEGSIEIRGTLSAANSSIGALNDVPMKVLTSACGKESPKIEGTKYFPSIEFTDENLKIRNLNDRPLTDFVFQEDSENQTYMDPSNIRKLDIKGNLNFTKAFEEEWQQIIQNIVMRNKFKKIPGETTITGDTSARLIFMDYLNGIEYPSDYIVKSGPLEAVIKSEKVFKTLSVSDLQGVETINGIDADDFVITNADQDLKHRITFKNLVIDETFQIDGKIVGLPEQNFNPDLTLLNSNLVQSNVELTKLHVTGKVHIGNSIAGIKWSELDNLIMTDEKNVSVTGTKSFLSRVHVAGNLDIDTKRINGQCSGNFITLDTPQILPNLSRILADVNFIKVTYDEIEKFQQAINSELNNDGAPLCLDKSIIFMKAPLLDELAMSFVNGNITGHEFSEKLSSVLKFAKFENLHVKNLITPDLIPGKVNNVSTDKLKNHRITKQGYQNIPGNITVRNLDVDRLFSDYVNGIPSSDLENLTKKVNIFYDELTQGNQTLRSLNVEGTVVTPSINDEDLQKSLIFKNISGFIFRNDGAIKSLTLDGLVNDQNFTSQLNDTVLKTDEFVVLRGKKKVQNLKSQNLHVDFINERPSEDVIHTDRNQIINGTVKIKGALEVQNRFNMTGRMNDVPFQKFSQKFSALGDKIHQINGSFIAQKNISIRFLDVVGRIQQKEMPSFIGNLIKTNQKDVTILGTKTLTDSVDFQDDIIITKNLNGINLEDFYRGATMIDRPISLSSKIVFEDDILIKNGLNVSTIEVGSIKGIDIAELMDNAVYINRPTSISEAVILSDVIFKSDLNIRSWNNIDMESLFMLHKDEFVKGLLICVDASVDTFEVKGLINDVNLAELYETTFTLSTDQNVTGRISFLDDIHAKRNFDSKFINGVGISQTVSLDEPGLMIGNFTFHQPITLEGQLDVQGNLNDVNISEWKSGAIMTNSQMEHRVTANWTVYGNVDIVRDITGSGPVNGHDIRKLFQNIQKHKAQNEVFISRKMGNLNGMCDDLKDLKEEVENMPYLFRSFENFESMFFDQRVVSFHHFSSGKHDYIMTNLENCRLDMFEFAAGSFIPLANVSSFGYVKEYITLKYENHVYIVTMGKSECGLSPGNLWKFENHQLTLILDLGNVTDMKQLGDDAFVVVADQQVREWLIKDILDNLLRPVNVISMKDKRVQFFINENETLLASPDTIYDLRSDVSGFDEFENPFRTSKIVNFQLGIDRREIIILYEEQMSRDYFLVCSGDISRRKILQVIGAHKPSSFSVLSFDKYQQNFLIFIENRRIIQIYEYHGVEGFKYHSSIRMKIDKLFIFKMRTKEYSIETFFLAAIHDGKVSILEAKMYGDRFDMESELECVHNESW